MKIKIYYFGKANEITSWEETYLQRIGFRASVETIPLSQAGLKDKTLNLAKEGALVLKKIDPQDFVIVLDENGKNLDSESISGKMEQAFVTHGTIVFIIGGAFGLDLKILERANLSLSFGKAVWTRNLVRLMLLEQIYRALEISAGSNFHKV
ncbi:23S rRNA (pseudouridine(1915)-N(3))-methyltransferase RlmH [Candidatus Peregrinibacteria bacterium]|nr:23S rRNA (pseudouridine(1915)-N(3))-methyltransferase RlmH [bacterium]NCQ56108.1 23S rRNA (pseudouridine(1915)-N(3))-methyltransferase RlmH [Candidatus Parcubacteria bacterium]NCS67920.1 23S rRNA (pseudouridine(1915)-N(3))-methyltransferase RlmH [Candidatus Peregrinibacteria bacterium]